MENINKNRIASMVATFAAIGLMGPISAFAFVSPATVNLGTASPFAILAESAITNTGATAITGNVGISPSAASFISGFALIAPPTTFTTSAFVTGQVFAADYDPPTPSNIGISVGDMLTAYTDALSRAADATNIINVSAGEIGGLSFDPGVYVYSGASSNVTISTDVTLNGTASDIWIFQIPGTLDIASGASVPAGIKVILTGGAQASNVFWAVSGATTLGTYSTFNGNILGATSIALQTGAVLNGRALAQTQVTLDANSVTVPVLVVTPVAPVVPVVVATPPPPSTSAARRSANMATYNQPSGNVGEVLGAYTGPVVYSNTQANTAEIRARLTVLMTELISRLQAQIEAQRQSQIALIKAKLVSLMTQLIPKLQAELSLALALPQGK
jgi:Protein of unknown function (DUF3494).